VNRAVFVISDLHLGGAPAGGGKPSFQMCSAEGQQRLAEFIRYAAHQRTDSQDVTLVIAGDIVDFLAEEEFAAFTNDDIAAARKLERVIDRTSGVWESLRAFAASGAKLVLMLGNHDIELSLPKPRRLLLDCLGPGRIEFIYDNQAYVDGALLVEHGNRYDSWNVISHDGLREVRSALSRGESPPTFETPAGSLMVINIMNGFKARFPFIDLLKPEDASVLPVLAVLDPSSLNVASKAVGLWRKQSQVEFDENGIPVDVQNIAKVGTRDEELVALAMTLYGDHADIGVLDQAKDFFELWQLTRSEKDKEEQLHKLYVALHARAESTWQTFDVNRETEPYFTPAKTSADRGFQVVVYGHTHLVKRVPLNDAGALYLNSGTWADLMQVPEAVLGPDEEEGKRQLKTFVEDLASNKLDKWRRQVPTFARIDIESEGIAAADVYFFDGPDSVVRVPDGPLTRLRVEEPLAERPGGERA
jgi:UDP-2,3-diacylglucosamine pyrophosphatase LpxH